MRRFPAIPLGLLLATLAVLALPRAAVAQETSVRFVDFRQGATADGTQRFQIQLDRAAAMRVHDELLTHRYFYLDFYGVAPGVEPAEWSPTAPGVFHVKQLYYAEQRVLRFVFYAREDVWFSVQTHGGATHEVQARAVRFRDLGAVSGELGGSIKRVVLDAGHGGTPGNGQYHLGARTSEQIDGRTIYEKEVVLAIARRLEALIDKAPNLQAVMTRVDDRYIGLEDRVERARQARGDLFVSIHTNATSSRRKTARGFEVYFLSDGTRETNRELVALENEGVNLEDTLSTDQTLGELIRQLADEAMGLRQAESRRLSEVIGREFQAAGPFREHYRGVKSAPFRVLMNFDMPAALVECGFLDHPVEGRLLTDPGVQQRIAGLLFNGLNRYFAMEDPDFRPTRVVLSP